MEKTVIELFAGVGGFRVGLNEITSFDVNGKAIERNNYKFVWSNQWEPSTKIQHAFSCYNLRFGGTSSENSNEDITLVNKKNIPNHTLLCGGFPCQDYSVARSLSREKGIEGKKGVLWRQIYDILEAKKTPFVLLENVDRLIKCPAKQRGRDFGIMLRSLADLGYACEWRVINAAEYGHSQRRRRIYIFAYRKNTNYYKNQKKFSPQDIFNIEGLFSKCFPIKKVVYTSKELDLFDGYSDLVDVTEKFSFPFCNSGYMINGKVFTTKTEPNIISFIPLNNIIENINVDSHYFLNRNGIEKFKYLRGSKKIERKNAEGKKYYYSEGSMSPYDDLTLPGRTMLTSEGSINRSTHIIQDPNNNRLRILTPIECERLQEFPDNWTNTMPERRRYFMMGNALVCGIIKKLGEQITFIIEKE